MKTECVALARCKICFGNSMLYAIWKKKHALVSFFKTINIAWARMLPYLSNSRVRVLFQLPREIMLLLINIVHEKN